MKPFRPSSTNSVAALSSPATTTTGTPRAEASIIFGTGITACEPGSVDGLILSVGDVAAAHAGLLARGADVRAVYTDDFHAPWVSFTDPDGNGWLLEETDRPAGGVARDGP